jgi:hypothetical protein
LLNGFLYLGAIAAEVEDIAESWVYLWLYARVLLGKVGLACFSALGSHLLKFELTITYLISIISIYYASLLPV